MMIERLPVAVAVIRTVRRPVIGSTAVVSSPRVIPARVISARVVGARAVATIPVGLVTTAVSAGTSLSPALCSPWLRRTTLSPALRSPRLAGATGTAALRSGWLRHPSRAATLGCSRLIGARLISARSSRGSRPLSPPVHGGIVSRSVTAPRLSTRRNASPSHRVAGLAADPRLFRRTRFRKSGRSDERRNGQRRRHSCRQMPLFVHISLPVGKTAALANRNRRTRFGIEN